VFFECDRYVVEYHGVGGRVPLLHVRILDGSVGADMGYLYPRTAKISLVTKKSTTRISTEEVTTACVLNAHALGTARVDIP